MGQHGTWQVVTRVEAATLGGVRRDDHCRRADRRRPLTQRLADRSADVRVDELRHLRLDRRNSVAGRALATRLTIPPTGLRLTPTTRRRQRRRPQRRPRRLIPANLSNRPRPRRTTRRMKRQTTRTDNVVPGVELRRPTRELGVATQVGRRRPLRLPLRHLPDVMHQRIIGQLLLELADLNPERREGVSHQGLRSGRDVTSDGTRHREAVRLRRQLADSATDRV